MESGRRYRARPVPGAPFPAGAAPRGRQHRGSPRLPPRDTGRRGRGEETLRARMPVTPHRFSLERPLLRWITGLRGAWPASGCIRTTEADGRAGARHSPGTPTFPPESCPGAARPWRGPGSRRRLHLWGWDRRQACAGASSKAGGQQAGRASTCPQAPRLASPHGWPESGAAPSSPVPILVLLELRQHPARQPPAAGAGLEGITDASRPILGLPELLASPS